MKMNELIEDVDAELSEAKPDKSYCQNTPRKKMSASWESSCVAQGFLSRRDDTYVGGKKVTGKTKKSVKYGGPVPDHS